MEENRYTVALEKVSQELSQKVQEFCFELDNGIIGKANRMLMDHQLEPINVALRFGGARINYTPICKE